MNQQSRQDLTFTSDAIVPMRASEQLVATELKRTRSRDRSSSSKFIVPGITGGVRCLSKKKKGRRNNNATKEEDPEKPSKRKSVDVKQLIRDIKKDRKRADVRREVAVRLKSDLEKDRIHSFQDIQDRLSHYVDTIITSRSKSGSSQHKAKGSKFSTKDDASVASISDASSIADGFVIEIFMSDSTKGVIDSPLDNQTPVTQTSSAEASEDSKFLTKATLPVFSEDGVDKSFLTKNTMSTCSESYDSRSLSYDSVEGPGDHLIQVIASSSSDLHIYEDDSLSASELSVPDLDSLYISNGNSVSGNAVPDLDSLHIANEYSVGMNALESPKAWTMGSSKEKNLTEAVKYRYRGRRQKYFSTSVAYQSTFGAF